MVGIRVIDSFDIPMKSSMMGFWLVSCIGTCARIGEVSCFVNSFEVSVVFRYQSDLFEKILQISREGSMGQALPPSHKVYPSITKTKISQSNK